MSNKQKPLRQVGRWSGIAPGGLAALMLFIPAPAASMAVVRMPASQLMAAATHRPSPKYPLLAAQQGAQGQVEVDVIVSPDGTVKEARAISGHLLLRETARATAAQWKFDPAKLNAAPNDVIGTIVFSFTVK